MKRRFRFFPQGMYDGILLFAVAYLSYHELIACWLNSSCVYAGDFADYSLWGMIVICAFLLLVHDGSFVQYRHAWKNNWPLGLFMLYAAASVSWSVVPERSTHAVYIMVASSLTASIFAVIRPPKTIFRILFGFTLLVLILSLLTILISPEIGIHPDPVWRGAWRGIFVHKNDFGALMALGNGLALLSFVAAIEKQHKRAALLFYFFTLFLAIMSRSATALILWFVLNGLTAAYFAWIKWGAKLRGKSFAYSVGILAGLASAGAFSIFAIFKLTGKNLNLTGRIPLWSTLLENVISKRPWFGYGLETLWSFPEFQKWASKAAGWGDEIVVVNGHNGYMDILLYLGVVGLFVLCVVLVQGVVRAVLRATTGRTWLNFFPLLALVYFLVANMTIDYMLEFESFHWMVLVAILFLPSGKFDETDFV